MVTKVDIYGSSFLWCLLSMLVVPYRGGCMFLNSENLFRGIVELEIKTPVKDQSYKTFCNLIAAL